MKKSILSTVASLMLAACGHAESAHKGWSAVPIECPPAFQFPVIRDVGMQGPWVNIKEPDPPTNGPFKGGYLFKTGSTVTLQKVYKLVANEEGTMNMSEVKITPVSVQKNEVIAGYRSASFSTEKVSFKAGDVFVVILKADGKTTTVFLKMTYYPFVPS